MREIYARGVPVEQDTFIECRLEEKYGDIAKVFRCSDNIYLRRVDVYVWRWNVVVEEGKILQAIGVPSLVFYEDDKAIMCTKKLENIANVMGDVVYFKGQMGKAQGIIEAYKAVKKSDDSLLIFESESLVYEYVHDGGFPQLYRHTPPYVGEIELWTKMGDDVVALTVSDVVYLLHEYGFYTVKDVAEYLKKIK